ncbi:MAG: terminase family protein, partial [Gammaproteobacteria bacterium]|nr:terminase family protein [Gammaproteobacteria bacterium]
MELEDLKKSIEIDRKILQYERENKLEFYSPYPFQVEYHNDQDPHKSLNAGNRPGKTECGGANSAYHATGRYPDWWEGKKYDHPILLIAGGKSNEKVRDLAQAILLGDPGDDKQEGTGFIPKSCIGTSVRKPGVPNAKLHQYVRHYTNGVYDGDSKITFLAYDAEDQAWMGFPADEVWLDEEPPEVIMGQATRATIDRGGSIGMTFTPESGRTTVVQMIDAHWSQHSASWMDASGGDFTITLANGRKLEFKTVYGIKGQKGHLTEEKVRNALKGMLPHQQEMRVLGEPMQGSGLIFEFPQDQVMCQPIEIPDHWPRIAAMDFGGTSAKAHPSAAAWAAHDVDNDIIYIYDCLKMFSNTPADVAARIIGRPQWIPMMWPHDGQKDAPAGGVKVKDMYKDYGVNMFHTWATNPDEDKEEGKGAYKREQALIEMNARFADRRLRIFNTLPEIW